MQLIELERRMAEVELQVGVGEQWQQQLKVLKVECFSIKIKMNKIAVHFNRGFGVLGFWGFGLGLGFRVRIRV